MKSLLLRPCETEDELHAWVRLFTGLSVPRRPLCPEHDAPFDYLRHSYFEPASDLVVWAARGGGKTRLAALATLLDLLHKPPASVRILGGSLEQSLKMWEYLLPDIERLAGDLLLARVRESSRRIRLATGAGAAVLTQSQRAVRGLRIQKLRCDEVELFEPRIWEAAQLTTRSIRTGQTPGASTSRERERAVVSNGERDQTAPLRSRLVTDIAGAVEALSTLHVAGGLMSRIVEQAQGSGTRVLRWCLLEVLARCEPERSCATCPLWEECRGRAKSECDGFISIDDAIRAKSRVSDQTWQAEMLCRRPSTRGRVFPAFDELVHLREYAGEAEAIVLAIDFGFSAPLAALWIAQMPDGLVHVIDEHIEAQKTISEHLKIIAGRPWPRASRVYCDPAGAGQNAQTATSDVGLLRAAGYVVRYRASRVSEGIEAIRHALRPASGEARLFIDPRCKGLVAALRGYRYPEGGGENPHKDGVHDHPIDALRYYFVNTCASDAVRVKRY